MNLLVKVGLVFFHIKKSIIFVLGRSLKKKTTNYLHLWIRGGGPQMWRGRDRAKERERGLLGNRVSKTVISHMSCVMCCHLVFNVQYSQKKGCFISYAFLNQIHKSTS